MDPIDVPAHCREAAEAYRKMLVKMKRLGLETADMPPELDHDTLVLHQNCLVVLGIDRLNREAEEGKK